MQNILLDTYRFFFARRFFLKLNRLVYHCGLRGLGILNYESDWVSGERRFLRDHVPRDQEFVVFDVGANVGSYSRAVLEINAKATVFAFEPHPETYRQLKETARKLKFEALNLALGDSEGTISLFDYADSDGSAHASVFREVIETLHGSKSAAHRVELSTVDVVAKRLGVETIDLLKIDTEGNELRVLLGAGGFLARGAVRAIQFEFNEMNVSSRSYFRDFWDMLPNFDLFRMLPDGLVKLERYDPVTCEIFAYQNIVALLRVN